MDNQQERPISVQFVAGLITGEGWFGIYGQPTARGTITYRPGFGIQMNDAVTMDQVIEAFKIWGLPLYVCPAISCGEKVGRRITVCGCKRVKRVAKFFLPYLTGTKKRAALKILEFVESRLSKPKGFSPYSKEEIQMVKDLRWTINSGRESLRRGRPHRKPGRPPSRSESSETIRYAPKPETAGEDIVQTRSEST